MTPRNPGAGGQAGEDLYPLLDELDQLEELLEEMEELGVASRADIERRMAELNARVNELSEE